MNSDLPATGTAALLELLAPWVLDDFINQGWRQGRTGGRHREHTAAQLFSRPSVEPALTCAFLESAGENVAGAARLAKVCVSAVPKPGLRRTHVTRVSGPSGSRRVAANQSASAPTVG